MGKKYICAVAGKSGGHIIPALTLCQDFLKDNKDFGVIFFTTNSKLDSEILSNYNFINNHIKLDINNLSKNPIKLFGAIFGLILSFFSSLKVLKKIKPEKIISTGGLVSIPVCIAARLLKIPVELYELNAIPGKAAKLLAKFNIKIFTVFSNTCNLLKNKNCSLVNYPVRFTSSDIIPKKLALEKLNFSENKKTVLILGGSQGSVSINNIVKSFFEAQASSEKYQVIHQTGKTQVDDLEKFYNKHKITNLIFDFKQNLADYYCASDIIISRAGAGSIFEILYFAKNTKNKKAIIIPLENTADNHQVENALAIYRQYPEIFVVERQGSIKPQNLI